MYIETQQQLQRQNRDKREGVESKRRENINLKNNKGAPHGSECTLISMLEVANFHNYEIKQDNLPKPITHISTKINLVHKKEFEN